MPNQQVFDKNKNILLNSVMVSPLQILQESFFLLKKALSVIYMEVNFFKF